MKTLAELDAEIARLKAERIETITAMIGTPEALGRALHAAHELVMRSKYPNHAKFPFDVIWNDDSNDREGWIEDARAALAFMAEETP